jgi:hypothetical protein
VQKGDFAIADEGGANQNVGRGRDEWRIHRSLGRALRRSDGDPRHHVDQEGSLGDVHNRNLLATLLADWRSFAQEEDAVTILSGLPSQTVRAALGKYVVANLDRRHQ